MEVTHTVICFVSIGAKFGICTIVGINGTLVEATIRTPKCPMQVRILATVQMTILAQIDTKLITVHRFTRNETVTSISCCTQRY